MKISPSDSSYKTFCNIITSYRLASVVTQAVKSGIIDIVGNDGCTEKEIIELSGIRQAEGQRFLAVLVNVGVLEKYAGRLYLSQFSRKYLQRSSVTNQLHVLEFEQTLTDKWRRLDTVLQQGQGTIPNDQSDAAYKKRLSLFQQSMHEAAVVRSKELWDAISVPSETGVVIDIGSGDGTYLKEFLKRFPSWQAIALDLDDVIIKIDDSAITGYACNLIDVVEMDKFVALYSNKASVVLLSNVIHCYSRTENASLFSQISKIVKDDGLVIVHDFFTDGNNLSALYDIHMMLNTYNGRTYNFDDTIQMLKDAGFAHSVIIELQSYSHAILASRQLQQDLETDPILLLRQKALSLGFFETAAVAPANIQIEAWVKAKCQYGCMFYGRKWSCPPHSIEADSFRELLACYSKAIILAGQPPLREFQQNLLNLEKYSFLNGFKKTLVFTGGPCSWCESCDDNRCNFPEKRRPSLESCGCDVFSLAEASGIPLKPIKGSSDFVQYIGLLLIE